MVEHYESQLPKAPESLKETLLELRSEEKEHMLEADALYTGKRPIFFKIWGAIVDTSSRLAVRVARLI